jgi:hypothetical protein
MYLSVTYFVDVQAVSLRLPKNITGSRHTRHQVKSLGAANIGTYSGEPLSLKQIN